MKKYSILLSIVWLNFLAGTAIFATTYTCPTLLPGGTYRDGQIMPGNNGNQWSLGMQADSVTISRDKPFQWGGSAVNKSSQFHRFSLICVGLATSTFDEPIEVTATSVVQANACHTINKKSFNCL